MLGQLNETIDYNGYVLYDTSRERPKVIGLVSKDYKRKALTTKTPRFIKDSLIQIEDKRFLQHNGIDFKAILRALYVNLSERKILQGGSTITQQLARNLKYDYRKSLLRKISESVSAIRIEHAYSKDQILELYFNNVYWGNNIYGLRAASLYYFFKEPFLLSRREQLMLLTLLRGPNFYINNLEKTVARYKALNNLLLHKTTTINGYRKLSKGKIEFNKNHLNVFHPQCVPFIINSIDETSKSIQSSLDLNLQGIVNKWVSDSKYPVSIICIENMKVKAISSTYGTSHPFLHKSNVGSTLKPFIYTFLRENGIDKNQVFSTRSINEIGWNVREVGYTKPYLTLSEALLESNNNVFINACFEIGIEKIYSYLSLLLQKNFTDFTPASILGSTKSGISIYELAVCYQNFFAKSDTLQLRSECYSLLKIIAEKKFDKAFSDIFLKTGTTNDNEQRYAILGNQKRVLAIVRGENPINDNTKEGNFLGSIGNLMNTLTKNTSYSWGR